MPQIVVRYNPALVAQSTLGRIDEVLSPQVLTAAVADGTAFTMDDIEFLTQPHGPCSKRVQNLAIEVRTMDLDARINNLNGAVEEMKRSVVEAVNNETIASMKGYLIWIQPIDRRGRHV